MSIAPPLGSDIAAHAIREATEQLLDPGNRRVWIHDWPRRYEPSLGRLRDFLQRHPEKFRIIPCGHTRYEVELVTDVNKGGAFQSRSNQATRPTHQHAWVYSHNPANTERRSEAAIAVDADENTVDTSTYPNRELPCSASDLVPSDSFEHVDLEKLVGGSFTATVYDKADAITQIALASAQEPDGTFVIQAFETALEEAHHERNRTAKEDSARELETKKVVETLESMLGSCASTLNGDGTRGLSHAVLTQIRFALKCAASENLNGKVIEGRASLEVVSYLRWIFLTSSLDACLQSLKVAKQNAVDCEEYLLAQTLKSLQGVLTCLPNVVPGHNAYTLLFAVSNFATAARQARANAEDALVVLQWQATVEILDGLAKIWQDSLLKLVRSPGNASLCEQIECADAPALDQPAPHDPPRDDAAHDCSIPFKQGSGESSSSTCASSDSVLVGLSYADFDGEPYGSEYISLTRGCALHKFANREEQSGWAYGICPDNLCEGWFPAAYWADTSSSSDHSWTCQSNGAE